MIRRSWVLAIAALCSVAAVQSAPQTVDELVARNIDAKGGLTRLKAVDTIKQTSTITTQGETARMTMYTKRPNMVRQEIQVGGQTVINAFDGETAWIVNPFAGSPGPIIVSGPQAVMIKEQSNFDGPLVDYQAQGYNVTLEGQETEDGRRMYHLRLVSATNQVSHLYLDAGTYLEVKQTTESSQFKLEQQLSDYRDVNGIKVPFHTRTLVNGVLQTELKVESVEFNVAIDTALFRVPKG